MQANSNGTVSGRDSRITTSGSGAALYISTFGGPGLIDLTNTAVQAQGAGTSGVASLNQSSTSVNNLRLSEGSLSSEANAIDAQGPLDITVSNGAAITGQQLLLETYPNSFGQPTTVHLDASGGSALMGDALVDAACRADISLATGSRWTGAALGLSNSTLDATSSWNLTANSNVTQDVANAGLIAFAPPTTGAFKTLTAANFIGQGGTVALFLGADGSPSDRWIVNAGAATGTTGLRVVNAGGPGGLTLANGIQVIDAINGAARPARPSR